MGHMSDTPELTHSTESIDDKWKSCQLTLPRPIPGISSLLVISFSYWLCKSTVNGWGVLYTVLLAGRVSSVLISCLCMIHLYIIDC